MLVQDSFTSGSICYAIQRWKPHSASKEPEWLQVKDRWLEIRGILEHLCSHSTVQKLCTPFGYVSEVITKGKFSEAMRIKIEGCDMTKVPLVTHCRNAVESNKNIRPSWVEVVTSNVVPAKQSEHVEGNNDESSNSLILRAEDTQSPEEGGRIKFFFSSGVWFIAGHYEWQ